MIIDLQSSIDNLQTQINQLKNLSSMPSLASKSSSDTAASATSPIPPAAWHWWEIPGAPNREFDMPSPEITTFLIDLYYEYFHSNHSFLLPKSIVIDRIALSSDYPVFFAMFSISCRFLSTDLEKCKQINICQYHKDPMYWVNLFEKHRTCLDTAALIKGLLLIGLSFSSGQNPKKSMEIANQIFDLCRWNNFDRRFSRNSEVANITSPSIIDSFSKTQLIYRESLIRTVWEVWRFRVQVAIFNDDPNMLPPFNGDKCLPVSDLIYENELKGWKFTRFFWSDLDAELLNEHAEITSNGGSAVGITEDIANGTSSPSNTFFSKGFSDLSNMSLEEREHTIYSGSCMNIVCVNLLSLVFKHHRSMNQSTLNTLENRLRMLYAKLPPVEKCRDYKGCYLISHEALYAAAFMLHQDQALSLMVFFHKNTTLPGTMASECFSNGISTIELRDGAYLRRLLKTPEEYSAKVRRSYIVCQWAAHCLFKLLKGPFPSNRRLDDYWKHLSPVTGFLLQNAIIVVASELVLQKVLRTMGDKQNTLSPVAKNYLEYPSFSVTKSSSASSRKGEIVINGYNHNIPSPDNTDSDATFVGPLIARYGTIENVTKKLCLFETMEEVMGTVWERIKDYRETTKWILDRALNYEI
jgi:hypothetical protein